VWACVLVEICGWCYDTLINVSCKCGWLSERVSYWVARDCVMTNQQQLYWLRCSDTMGLQL